MSTPVVTITQEELLSLSPEVRAKVREAVTAKRNIPKPQNTQTGSLAAIKDFEEDALPFTEPLVAVGTTNIKPAGLIIPDPYEQYLTRLPPSQTPRVLEVAAESHSLRAVHLLVNNQ